VLRDFFLKVVESLGQLIKILRQTQMELVVDKLIDFSGGKDEELRDISGLGTCSGCQYRII
jgi:cullin-associated NEDD8-dissociated protein 1